MYPPFTNMGLVFTLWLDDHDSFTGAFSFHHTMRHQMTICLDVHACWSLRILARDSFTVFSIPEISFSNPLSCPANMVAWSFMVG